MIRAEDIDATVEVMLRSGLNAAGMRSPRVFRALAEDAVRTPKQIMIAVAGDESGKLIAVVLAITERTRYWREFSLHHPRAAMDIVGHRLKAIVRRRLRKLRRAEHEVPAAPVDPALVQQGRELVAHRIVPLGKERWSDEAPDIAKIMYLAVDPTLRKGGVSIPLFRFLFSEMKRRGIRRADGQINGPNIPAIKMDRQFPFYFHEVPGGYFIWLLVDEVEAFVEAGRR